MLGEQVAVELPDERIIFDQQNLTSSGDMGRSAGFAWDPTTSVTGTAAHLEFVNIGECPVEVVPDPPDPEHCGHASKDIRRAERLGEKIVRPEGEANCLHLAFSQHGYDNYGSRYGDWICLQVLTDLEPAHTGHHEVQQNEVGWVFSRCHERSGSVLHQAHGVAILSEDRLQEFPITLLVVYDQDIPQRCSCSWVSGL